MLSDMERSLAFIAVTMLVSGILLWRGSLRRRMIQRGEYRDDSAPGKNGNASSAETVIREMEVRLFEYGREVEGRVETTLNVLDRLIIDAEDEIDRLEELLERSEQQKDEPSTETIDPARILQLSQAGLSHEEIARAMQCDQALVEHVLEDKDRDAA